MILPMRRALICCLTVAVFQVLTVLHPAPPGFLSVFAAPPASDERSTPEVSPALAALHALVERAFVRCDASALKPAFSRRGKTFVAASALSRADGYYGADQLVLLFGRLFEGRSTIRFTALAPAPRVRSDGRAVLPVAWISRGRESSRHEVRFNLIMALEGKVWHVREIRDLK